jgi:hypothetical protein
MATQKRHMSPDISTKLYKIKKKGTNLNKGCSENGSTEGPYLWQVAADALPHVTVW